MGAGILPMAIRDGTPYYLFGREGLGQDKGYWSDFGGGKERGESFRDTALREAHEESDGILGTKEAIRELLDKHLIDQITLGGYRLYVVYVTLDTTLPKKFRKGEKLILGVPFYGYEFNNSNVSSFSFSSMVSLNNSYAEIDNVGTKYYNGRATIARKVKLASTKLSGIMVWELGQDSFNDYSLLKTIHKEYYDLGVKTTNLCNN